MLSEFSAETCFVYIIWPDQIRKPLHVLTSWNIFKHRFPICQAMILHTLNRLYISKEFNFLFKFLKYLMSKLWKLKCQCNSCNPGSLAWSYNHWNLVKVFSQWNFTRTLFLRNFGFVIYLTNSKIKSHTLLYNISYLFENGNLEETATRHCCRHRRHILPALRLRPLTDPRLPVDPANVIEGFKLMDMLKLLYIWSCNVMDKV